MSTEHEETSRTHFAVALAGVIVPFLGFFITAGVACLALLRQRDRAPATWTKRLFALAVVDFLVFLSLAAFGSGRLKLQEPGATTPLGPRIGVVLDARDAGGGALVAGVRSGSPAERVGVREGDLITAVDDSAIADNAALHAAIEATPEGKERSLAIARHGESVQVRVVPERHRELFQPEDPAVVRAAVRQVAKQWGVVAALVGAVAVAAWRRGAPRPPSPFAIWLGLCGIFALSDLVLLGVTLGVGRVLVAPSFALVLLAQNLASGVFVVAAMPWRARLERAGALEPLRGDASTFSAVVLGAWAAFAGVVRVAIVLSAATSLFHLSEVDPGQRMRELLAQCPGPQGIAMLAFGAVVLAPIGEETLFRGVLLPWLCRWMTPETAVWASALVFGLAHSHYGIYAFVVVVYGLVFGWARLRTGRLRASIILHAIVNGVVLALALRGR